MQGTVVETENIFSVPPFLSSSYCKSFYFYSEVIFSCYLYFNINPSFFKFNFDLSFYLKVLKFRLIIREELNLFLSSFVKTSSCICFFIVGDRIHQWGHSRRNIGVDMNRMFMIIACLNNGKDVRIVVWVSLQQSPNLMGIIFQIWQYCSVLVTGRVVTCKYAMCTCQCTTILDV